VHPRCAVRESDLFSDRSLSTPDSLPRRSFMFTRCISASATPFSRGNASPLGNAYHSRHAEERSSDGDQTSSSHRSGKCTFDQATCHNSTKPIGNAVYGHADLHRCAVEFSKTYTAPRVAKLDIASPVRLTIRPSRYCSRFSAFIRSSAKGRPEAPLGSVFSRARDSSRIHAPCGP